MHFSEAFSPGRAIRHGFEGLKRQPAGMLLGGFLMMVTQGGGGGSGSGGDFSNSEMEPEAQAALAMMTLVIVGIGCCVGLVMWLAQSFLQPGWIRMHKDLVETGQAGVSVLFSGSDAFTRMALWKLLKGVIVMGTVVAAAAPGGALVGYAFYLGGDPSFLAVGAVLLALLIVPTAFYVGYGLVLGEYAVALEGVGPMEALSRSWELADGNRFTLFFFSVAVGLVNFVGLLLCCFPLFATFPSTQLGWTESYLLATRDDAEKLAGTLEPAG